MPKKEELISIRNKIKNKAFLLDEFLRVNPKKVENKLFLKKILKTV